MCDRLTKLEDKIEMHFKYWKYYSYLEYEAIQEGNSINSFRVWYHKQQSLTHKKEMEETLKQLCSLIYKEESNGTI